ncbi:MAG TPA: SbcC/MukB-like Walker B domain-containing protein, partial [Acidimicrobiales bacterium]|nr:SbcC/MukB-like Walker B domain-containing protein [Acidimicrobiales bacterium]
VTALLGLTFEHFTKCVVLPQGAFARFLHDKPAAHQDLLAELLGLGVYAQLGQHANREAAAATNRAALAEEQLARPPLVDAGPCAVARAASRVADLERVQAVVVADEPVVAGLAARRADALVRAEAARGRASSLQSLAAPVGLDGLSVELRAADAERAAADEEMVRAERATADAEVALAAAPARRVLEAAGQIIEERDELVARNEKAQRVIGELVEAETEIAAELGLATTRVADARGRREAGLHSHQAASLTALLVVGEPCPVCQHPVGAVPPGAASSAAVLPDLEVAGEDLRRAEQALAEVSAGHREAAVRRAKGEEKVAAGIERLAHLDTKLVEYRSMLPPDAATDLDRSSVQSLIAVADAADERLSSARAAERRARTCLRDAAERLAGLQRAGKEAWEAFDRVRDRLAVLGPPSVDRADLAGAWAALVEWASERRPEEEQEVADALEEVSGIEGQQRARQDALLAACAAAGLDVDEPTHRGRPLGEIVAGALAHAVAQVRRDESAASEASRLRTEAEDARCDAQVAHALGQHLKSSGFEKWLLDEVQAQLVAGATTLLRDLSSGGYSLALDEVGGFAVVDHRNADQLRSARTLSGGETFLASLALALALADRLSGFAAEGAAPLEAIFLDEGFGALDPDTLDTVAAAIENLAAEGRVVGIVTHVRDLADRIPVRFEVEKGPTTSTVRRVEG